MKQFQTHKLQYYPHHISKILNGEIPSPVQCEITLTTACNYKCPWCVFSYMSHKNEHIDADALKMTLSELKDMGLKSVVYAGSGEPFLYSDINKIIEFTKDLGIKCGITTNGSMIKNEHIKSICDYVDWIRISLGSVNNNIFSECHGTKKEMLFNVLKNIIKLNDARVKYNSDLQIGVQAVLINKDAKNYIDIIEKCNQIGVDYFMLRPYYGNPNNDKNIINRFEMTNEEINEINDDINFYLNDSGYEGHTKVFLRQETADIMFKRSYKYCHALPLVFAIEANGDVYNCFPNRGDNSEYRVGNINEDHISDIWGGEKHKKFLYKIMPNIDKNKCQPQCRHHPANEYLQSIIDKPEGYEFI